MRVEHPWFTSRATTMWRAKPARSIMAMVPAGCDESSVGAYLARWLPENFEAPTEGDRLDVVVARIVPDAVTSCAGFLSQLAKELQLKAEDRSALLSITEPSEALETIIDCAHALGKYPVLIIERFHSFAHVVDDTLLSMLSRMRSLEQSSTMTTIAISPLSYADLRRVMASSLPFVNSSYGDAHDLAVMSPLSFEEFSRVGAAYNIPELRLRALFGLGGGPDAVFQAIFDELESEEGDFVERCSRRAMPAVERFLQAAIGPIQENLDLLNRLRSNALTDNDISYLNTIPQRDLLLRRDERGIIMPPIMCESVKVILREHQPRIVEAGRDGDDLTTRVLLITANSLDAPLDIEDEIRSMHREIDGASAGRKIDIKNCHAATPDDVVKYLRKYRPHIVHFSGHGSEAGIFLRDDGGGEIEVPGAAIANTFRGRAVRLAVFNVCSSQGYAAQVAHHVEAVICTNESVEDVAAKRFSAAFYRTIGDGFSVDEAFRDACNAVELYDLQSVFELFGDGSLKLV